MPYIQVKNDEQNSNIMSVQSNMNQETLDEIISYLIEEHSLGIKEEDQFIKIGEEIYANNLMIVRHDVETYKEENFLRIEFIPRQNTDLIKTYHTMETNDYINTLNNILKIKINPTQTV